MSIANEDSAFAIAQREVEKAHELKKACQKKLLVGCFECVIIPVLAMMAFAVFTRFWYISQDSVEVIEAASRAKGERLSTYQIGLMGIVLKQEFCEPIEGCIIGMNQYRSFDDSENQESIKWKNMGYAQDYAEPVARARSAGKMVFMCAFTCGAVWVLLLAGWLSLCCLETCLQSHLIPRLGYIILIAVVAFYIMAVVVWGSALINFSIETGPLRDVMEEKKLIPGTNPSLKMHHSFFLAIGSLVLSMLATPLMYFSIPAVDKTGAKESKETAARAARFKNYFRDIENTSFVQEALPLDNRNTAISKPGWTRKVVAARMNFAAPTSCDLSQAQLCASSQAQAQQQDKTSQAKQEQPQTRSPTIQQITVTPSPLLKFPQREPAQVISPGGARMPSPVRRRQTLPAKLAKLPQIDVLDTERENDAKPSLLPSTEGEQVQDLPLKRRGRKVTRAPTLSNIERKKAQQQLQRSITMSSIIS